MVAPKTAPEPAANPRAGKEAVEGKAEGRAVTGGRFRALNEFVDRAMRDLTRAEISVWLVLYRDERNGAVRVSVNQIAERAGASSRSVIRALERLKKLGMVEPILRGGLNRGPSIYRIQPVPTGGRGAGGRDDR